MRHYKKTIEIYRKDTIIPLKVKNNTVVPIDFKSTSDGWRGKLAKNFTFENVKLLGNAISRFIVQNSLPKTIVIGYDTRFMSKEFALFLSEIFSNNGIKVFLLKTPCTTPLLTFTTLYTKSKIGLTVTASHNPIFDDGIKIRMGYGGAPLTQITQDIEKCFSANYGKLQSTNKGEIIIIDPKKNYIKKIKSLLNFSKVTKQIKVLVDPMHGTSRNLLKRIVQKSGIKIDYINYNYDPYFGGFPPEPKYETTKKLQDLVLSKKYNLGIAHDGDGDRIIAVSQGHGYLSPHDVSAIILWYLVLYKKEKGKVIGSSTLGRKVRLLCQYFNIEFEEIPVGFKNATQIMLDQKVLLAAEENGGIGFGFYLPERDAILAAAILCEIESNIKGGVDYILSEIEKITGESGFSRFNFTPSTDRQQLMLSIKQLSLEDFPFGKVKNISKMDGVKINFENNDWISIRFSGTEDIIRIYAESNDRETAEKLIQKTKNILINLEK